MNEVQLAKNVLSLIVAQGFDTECDVEGPATGSGIVEWALFIARFMRIVPEGQYLGDKNHVDRHRD